VAVVVVAAELQEHLHARERELDSREGIVAMWEDALAGSERTLGRVCVERDAECIHAEATQQDYNAKTRASSSMSKHSINLNRMLEEH
jgi:hypothetical protein